MTADHEPAALRARYVMVGGFLGAGKTTALARAARILSDRGLRVGLITNDQSQGLVDTALLRSKGWSVEEISGGCFCCRFPSLREAAQKLSLDQRPEVFLAEPVGSCTDLVATVSYPLRRMYGDDYQIAPLSVLVDPVRCARILGLAEGRAFSPKVEYVYRKQLEEAGLILVNKCDELEPALRDALVSRLQQGYPQATVRVVSAREGEGIEAWLDELFASETIELPTMDLDYDDYAEGEALLGWLNATYRFDATAEFDADAFLMDLATRMRDRVQAGGGEVAHLKMTLDGGDPMGHISVVSVVRGDGPVELRESLAEPVRDGTLVVNLRAEAEPRLLRDTVEAAVTEVEADKGLCIEHLDHFRPARPTPVHRVSVSETTP